MKYADNKAERRTDMSEDALTTSAPKTRYANALEWIAALATGAIISFSLSGALFNGALSIVSYGVLIQLTPSIALADGMADAAPEKSYEPAPLMNRAMGERLATAVGHYNRSRALLLEAMREFDRGRDIARPDALIDSTEWREALAFRARELERVLAPQARVTRSGVRLGAAPQLLDLTGSATIDAQGKVIPREELHTQEGEPMQESSATRVEPEIVTTDKNNIAAASPLDVEQTEENSGVDTLNEAENLTR